MKNLSDIHGYPFNPLILALLLSSPLMLSAAPQIPDAGTLRQQTVPTLPAAPSSIETGVKPPTESGINDSTAFTVKQINFTGNTLINTETLHDLVKPLEGTEQTLTSLQQKVYEISDYYHNQGYPFARAIIPQQEITEGVVLIEIIEAKYGEIKLNNTSRVSDALLQSTLSNLNVGNPIAQKPLDRSLLLLSDIPGININANIQPGQAVATSDLLIDANPESNFIGRFNVDDYGNKYINRPRVGANLSFLNPAQHGDVLSLNLLTTGERMQYGQVSYDLLLNGQGTHLGAAYSALKYELGEELARLGVHGNSNEASLWLKHPLIRSKSYNLYGQVQYDHNTLEDRVDASQLKNDRTVQQATFTLSGDSRDSFITQGITSWRLAYSQGDVDFDNSNAQISDAATANTEGSYSKWNLNINRLQTLTNTMDLWVSVTAQLANDNLDSSQKMVFGGPFSVRAYDTGAVSGDNGVLATVEVRHILSQQYGVWQAVAFADVGHVKINDQRWASVTGKNQDTLSGVGIGMNWFGNNQWTAKATVATSVGSSSDFTRDADKTILWMEVSKGF